MDFNRFSISELKKFRKRLGNDTVSCILRDEINELIEYKRIPNVFKVYTNSEPFIKTDELLSYISSYCVKNSLGLKKLRKYLNVHVEGEKNNYPIIVDVFRDYNGILRAKSLNKAWSIFSVDKIHFLKGMFKKRYMRDINIELPTGKLLSKTIGLDIMAFVRVPVTNKNILVCRRSINSFNYYYAISDNKISCFDENRLDVEDRRPKYAGKIILYNLKKEYDSEKLIIKKFKLKNINYNVYYGKQLKEFIKNMRRS